MLYDENDASSVNAKCHKAVLFLSSIFQASQKARQFSQTVEQDKDGEEEEERELFDVKGTTYWNFTDDKSNTEDSNSTENTLTHHGKRKLDSLGDEASHGTSHQATHGTSNQATHVASNQPTHTASSHGTSHPLSHTSHHQSKDKDSLDVTSFTPKSLSSTPISSHEATSHKVSLHGVSSHGMFASDEETLLLANHKRKKTSDHSNYSNPTNHSSHSTFTNLQANRIGHHPTINRRHDASSEQEHFSYNYHPATPAIHLIQEENVRKRLCHRYRFGYHLLMCRYLPE